MTGSDAAKTFYKHVRAYKCREKPPGFNVTDLYPGESDQAVAEKLAEHLNSISKEFSGIIEDEIPKAESRPLPVLTREEVEERLITFKKEKLMAGWKVESVTPIPKTPIPQGPDYLRNISCRNLFSKVYE